MFCKRFYLFFFTFQIINIVAVIVRTELHKLYLFIFFISFRSFHNFIIRSEEEECIGLFKKRLDLYGNQLISSNSAFFLTAHTVVWYVCATESSITKLTCIFCILKCHTRIPCSCNFITCSVVIKENKKKKLYPNMCQRLFKQVLFGFTVKIKSELYTIFK